MPVAIPAGLLATITLSASSVLLGFLFPLAAGLLILGIVRVLVDREWRPVVAGLLASLAVVALGVFLRTWGAGLAAPEQLAAPTQTASLVFTVVTPWGVLAAVVLIGVGILHRYVGRALARRREPREPRDPREPREWEG